jgi:tetratricopeptide (TPR) repeat protein
MPTMKYFALLLICFAINADAQNNLTFNKQFTDCNNKWVALKTAKDSVFGFGFIYMDESAGLTAHEGGTFRLTKDNKYIASKRPDYAMKTVRLDGMHNTVALIPADMLKQLDLPAEPAWLSSYKADTTSANWLFRWGLSYNANNQIDKALYYLDRVKKIDPNYHGLAYEYIFAYNATRQFDKAIELLNGALKEDPKSANYLKELLFAYVHSGKMDKAEETYKKAVAVSGIDEKSEMAFNVLSAYLMQKNKEKSKIWIDDIQTWLPTTDRYYASFQKMKEYYATLK